jgi:hypothetical protein
MVKKGESGVKNEADTVQMRTAKPGVV